MTPPWYIYITNLLTIRNKSNRRTNYIEKEGICDSIQKLVSKFLTNSLTNLLTILVTIFVSSKLVSKKSEECLSGLWLFTYCKVVGEKILLFEKEEDCPYSTVRMEKTLDISDTKDGKPGEAREKKKGADEVDTRAGDEAFQAKQALEAKQLMEAQMEKVT